MIRLHTLSFTLILTAQSVVAQTEPTALERLFEMGAHERLAQTRQQATSKLKPFTTDGCSGHQSELWDFIAEQIPSFDDIHNDTPPWENCCITHDRAYHIGGFDRDPNASFAARASADKSLYACVIQTASDREAELVQSYGMTPSQVDIAYTAIAQAMFIAVRLGGAPCSGLPWRWGYGYEPCGLFD